ncbi:MAG TPA: hypothetical protein VNF68_07385, partial [Candidatus Baltobacteraceae bacterium]|nr:hypothetical protein [Candidatus Baltobacteraceae bacterium]
LERIGRGLRDERGRPAAFNVLLFGDPHAAAFHWHVEVAVRLGLLAGFELSTGAFIREGEAKESAERWRRIVGSAHGSI